MNNELDLESILRDLTNNVFTSEYDREFSLVVGKNWANWAHIYG